MQIHELPSGTPDIDDALPFDTGGANYKAPFSSFEVGENTATFESSDEADPQQFKTVDQVETGPIKTILNRLSMAVSNVRYLGKLIGNSIMGTTANTITGAVAELKSQVGIFECVSMDIGYTSGEPLIDKVQRAFYNSAMPYGKPFIAQVVSGAQYTMVGFWYRPNSSGYPVYGYCYIGNFDDFFFVRLDNGTWKVTPNVSHTSTTSVTIKIGTGSNYTGTIARSGKLRVYNFYYSVNSAVGTINLTTPIGTVRDDDKPRYEATAAISMYTSGDYSGTTYSGNLMVNASGQLLLRGKVAEIAACKEFRGLVTWMVD